MLAVHFDRYNDNRTSTICYPSQNIISSSRFQPCHLPRPRAACWLMQSFARELPCHIRERGQHRRIQGRSGTMVGRGELHAGIVHKLCSAGDNAPQESSSPSNISATHATVSRCWPGTVVRSQMGRSSGASHGSVAVPDQFDGLRLHRLPDEKTRLRLAPSSIHPTSTNETGRRTNGYVWTARSACSRPPTTKHRRRRMFSAAETLRQPARVGYGRAWLSNAEPKSARLKYHDERCAPSSITSRMFAHAA